MDSLIGIISISLIFIVVLAIIYFLSNNSIFAGKNKSLTSQIEKQNDDKVDSIAELKRENEELDKEIKFLEEKNRRLKLKIEQMKRIIASLQEQKAQLEKSENRLKELRLKKDESLAMAAHDIINPASTIKNFVDLLESYDLTAQEQHDVLSGLIETSSRLVKLANEFTNVISEEYVPQKIHKSKHKLKKAIESIVMVNRIKASEKNIEIRLYQPELDLVVDIDEDKIKEVVDNLVGNAIKYCPAKSKVDVITKVVDNDVIVEVTDNGFGLTEDEVAHAFEKGSKLSTKPTGNETSSGLGLWISKKIIEEHNGRIFVKSKKGVGTTFAFKIPIK